MGIPTMSHSHSTTKYNRSERLSSSGSLPRSPSGLDPPAVPDRKFTTASARSIFTSGRITPSVTEDVDDHKRTLQELNERLVSYVDKVRKLQNAADVIDSLPRQTNSEESVLIVKNKYEAEINDWRAKYEEAQNIIAQIKIDLGNLKQDNSQLNLKYADLVGGDEILLQGNNRLVPFRVNDKLGLLRE